MFHGVAVAAVFAIIPLLRAECSFARLPQGFGGALSGARALVEKAELRSISIAVAQDGKIVCEEAFGWADRRNKVRVTAGTIYAVGSVAKAVTGTAIFILANEGRLRLDDSPEKHRVHVSAFAGGTSFFCLAVTARLINRGDFYSPQKQPANSR